MLNASVIHQDFYTAPERLKQKLFQQRNQVQGSDPQKAVRLKKLGFHKAAPVVWQPKDTLLPLQQLEKQLTQLRYYMNRYPAYPFIIEPEVKRLCAYYGLVFGPIDNFTSDVPEKKLAELEEVNIDTHDRTTQRVHCFTHNETNEQIFRPTGLNMMEREELDRIYTWKGLKIIPAAWWIAAHSGDFDLTGKELQEGYKLNPATADDPVVFCPVQGGYLIIAAWGSEEGLRQSSSLN